jgi:hypothetical protein
MNQNPRLVQVGTSDPSGAAVAIVANVVSLGNDVPVAVTLSADYAMLTVPGYPFRASFTGGATVQYPHTLSSGATVKVLKCEADALSAAGAATLA